MCRPGTAISNTPHHSGSGAVTSKRVEFQSLPSIRACQSFPASNPVRTTRAEAAGVVTGTGAKPRSPGERLAASYVNFYIANGGVVVPLLDARTDRAALAKIRRLFPGRQVVGVPAREILLGGGNIHCITQQIPAG